MVTWRCLISLRLKPDSEAQKFLMTQLLLDALRQFRTWERPSQMGLLLALILLLPAFVVAANGPDDLRRPATLSVMGLVFVAQAIFLWANRGMVTPYTRAQRQFKAGDFAGARATLEALRGSRRADFRVLTLLGNTYRQLGLLAESHSVLYEAVDMRPDHYFPLYGLGRTLLFEGLWGDAAVMIARSLEYGSPAAVRFDLAEAWYAAGKVGEAVLAYGEALPDLEDEPHRAMMARYRLHIHDQGEPPANELLIVGLPYWEAIAEVHDAAPYGERIAQDLISLRALVREG